jgi:hypothetical protein
VLADLADDTGADMATALAALLNCATAKPGTSWRVGVGRVTAEDKARAQDAAAAAVLAAAAQKRIVLRQANDHQEAKPAVMTVGLPTTDSSCLCTFLQTMDAVSASNWLHAEHSAVSKPCSLHVFPSKGYIPSSYCGNMRFACAGRPAWG